MEKAILFFCLGEMYWEFARFVPHFIWKRTVEYKKRKDINFIVMTKPENFDMYGRYANILVPFRLKNNSQYKPNCFRLDNMTTDEYNSIIHLFAKQFQDRYNIIDIVYPKIGKKDFANKRQFPMNKFSYKYLPRNANLIEVEKNIDDRKIVCLGPRYRPGLRRNWPYWNDLYNLIYENKKLTEKYNFVICGKELEYSPDIKNRFLDINKFNKNINTSLIGFTMEILKKAVLTVGSQSAIPNISLLFGTHALMWGHQKNLHIKHYNVKNTKVTFIDDLKYNLPAKTIYTEMLKILGE